MSETALKPENKIVSKQLDDKSRKALWHNLNRRIEAAEDEIKKITHWPADLDSKLWPVDPETKEPAFTEVEKTEKAGKMKLADEIHPENEKDLRYLKKRIHELQLSLRLAFNTNWLVEQRHEMIADTKKILLEEFGPGWEMKYSEDTPEAKAEKLAKEKRHRDNVARLNDLTKAVKCNRKGCYTGRGWIGLKTGTGEFIPCKCTQDTLQYYKLHD